MILFIEHAESSIIVLVIAIEGQHREEPHCAEIHFQGNSAVWKVVYRILR